MSKPFALPTNWVKVLDEMHEDLLQATQLAEAREATLAGQAAQSLTPPGSNPVDRYLEGLDERVHQVRQPLQELAGAFQQEEEHVRQHLVRSAELRQRLANWAGRS